MNFLDRIATVIKWVTSIMFFLGFFLVVGGIGTQDYADEIGVVYPISKTIKVCLIGFVMMIPFVWYSKTFVEEGDDL